MASKFTKDDILTFLRQVPIMSIAVNLADKPISSVVAFAVDQDFSFYFVTKRNTYKAQALQQNPQISISVWEHNKILVQACGIAREIEDQRELDSVRATVVKSISHIKNFWWPILDIQGEHVSYKIQTEWLRVLDLSNTTSEAQERYFEVNL